MTELRFFLDENIEVEIAKQLQRRGIDVVHVRDLHVLGDADENQLQRASEQGRVLCTYDSDFVNLAQQGVEHAGIVKGNRTQHHIGSWVRALTQLHSQYSAEDLLNRVEFL